MQAVITQAGDTIDLICWRHRGTTQKVVEQTLAMNPGLAARGPVLPAGVTITLPDVPALPIRETVKLWD
ncbi:MAG: tail protein X [Caenibius sp.]